MFSNKGESKMLKNLLRFFSRQNFYRKILFYISIPSLLAVCLAVGIIFSCGSSYKSLLKHAYSNQLEQFCSDYDNQLQSVSLFFRALYNNKNFINTVNGDVNSDEDIYSVQKILRQIKSTYDFIDEVAIVEKVSGRVYTQNTVHTMHDYFNSVYKYDEYNYSYWVNYKAPLSEKCILSPSDVYKDGIHSLMIPIVFTRIDKIQMSNYIIVNVDLTKILTELTEKKLSDNSIIQIASKPTRRIFDLSMDFKEIDNDMMRNLLSGKNAIFDLTDGGKKYCMVSYQAKNSILGYSYIASIPYSDIYARTLQLILILLFITIAVSIIVVFFIHYGSHRIYSPLEQMANLFNTDNATIDPDDLQDAIEATLSANRTMKRKIDASLPMLEEQYLIRILNSSEHYYPNAELEEKIHFDYNYFCSIIIRFNMTDSFYKKYDYYQKNLIENSLFNIIQCDFSKSFRTYVIPSNEHTLYILLNLENNTGTDKINAILDNFKNCLKPDINDISLSTSVGSINVGIDGLKQSHREAMNNISGISWANRIELVSKEKSGAETFIGLSVTDETLLYNHLMSGNTDEALEIINSVFTENSKHNISSDDIKKIYMQIFHITFKIFKIKNIKYDNDNIGDIRLISDILSNPIAEINSRMLQLFETIQQHSATKKVNINGIIEYIQKHYKEDIYLELMADMFNTSSSYLSRLIKQETSVTFSQYLNNLRIEDAKHQLINTNNTITDIYTGLGFTNRSTFVRVFKSIVGLTPSEFRKSASA